MQTVAQPLQIPVPGSADIKITSTANAYFHQRVTVEDFGDGGTFIFHGRGEGVPMQLDNGRNQIELAPVREPYRTLSVTGTYSRSGRATDYHVEAAVKARTWADYGDDQNTPLRISWEIDTEDGEDQDFNDSVIVIVADLNVH